MSDISIHLSLMDVLMAIPVLGWPGLLVGAALGALVWRKRRIAGGVFGALLGSLLWCAALFVPKLF